MEEAYEKLEKAEQRIHKEEHASQRILGIFLILVAGLNILEALVKMYLRYTGDNSMLAGNRQSYIAIAKLFVIAFIYLVCLVRMRSLYFHSPYVRKLLFLWGVILIPVQLIYDATTLIYNKALVSMWMVLYASNPDTSGLFYAMFYDSTHGFKYLGMFLSVIIGIIVTGVILERYGLILVSGALTFLFMISFAAIQMKTMTLDVFAMEIGLNGTSLIFHSMMTAGLLVLGLYILLRYRPKPI